MILFYTFQIACVVIFLNVADYFSTIMMITQRVIKALRKGVNLLRA